MQTNPAENGHAQRRWPRPAGWTQSWLAGALVMGATWLIMAAALAAPASGDAQAQLNAKYLELAPRLNQNQFSRPMVIDSVESPTDPTGEVYAVMDFPYASVQRTFTQAGNWCDVLILHINTKYCQQVNSAGGPLLQMGIGSKSPEAMDRAFRLSFDFRVTAATPDYFEVNLGADKGPLATSHYRIRLAAMPLPNGRTFLHLTYSYEVGMAGRLAMQAYLATAGMGKVGFTIVSTDANGKPDYVKGVRGVVERNTMRYYLAIASYLGAAPAPRAEQMENRLQAWYDATERYPRQLHEVDRVSYMSMKRDEYKRQQTLIPQAASL